ncbi:hypothetical protein F971_01503 [Acinetobacter vivianii]|uniref:Ribbon-helix-helix protein CopG domain-containing protein n=1 Tax=Acinetobacter vivianii TaxID=1776742 RepID=N8UY77_9GAMM|nr:hypothetical protein [Acinetobacter vivianii]ENU92521.1 hypothetical protein F971_01503 [Acinetobacter vivianii]
MSSEKTPQILSRAPKLDEPRRQVAFYLPKSEVDKIIAEMKRTNRSRSSIIGERYYLGLQAQEKE